MFRTFLKTDLTQKWKISNQIIPQSSFETRERSTAAGGCVQFYCTIFVVLQLYGVTLGLEISWRCSTFVCRRDSEVFNHDDVIKWKHFPRYWPFVRGIPRSGLGLTQSFDVFFDLRLNKRLSKQSWCCWFEMSSRPLWRHCNANETAKYKTVVYGTPRIKI